MTEELTVSRVVSKTHVKVKGANGREKLVYCDKGYKVGATVLVQSGIVLSRTKTDKSDVIVNV